MWKAEHSIETPAAPEKIWALFEDVPGWKQWNAGIESIALEGAFATGGELKMTPTGQSPMTSTLVEVRRNEAFTDETQVGDITVRVDHRIARAGNKSRITFAVEVEGPQAAEIGPMVSGDFPDVLAALAKKAEAAK